MTKIKELRPEAVGFIHGVLWSMERKSIDLEEGVTEAKRRWPPFDPPTEAEVKAGKAPKLGN